MHTIHKTLYQMQCTFVQIKKLHLECTPDVTVQNKYMKTSNVVPTETTFCFPALMSIQLRLSSFSFSKIKNETWQRRTNELCIVCDAAKRAPARTDEQKIHLSVS